MHPTQTYDLIALDHTQRLDAVRIAARQTQGRAVARTRGPAPERPPERVARRLPWLGEVLPATALGAVAR